MRRAAIGAAAGRTAAGRAARLAVALTVAVLAAVPAGCGRGESRGRTKVTVYAAASLAPAMEEIAGVHRIRTGDEVAVELAASGALAKGIDAGAPADVFISASAEWMSWLIGRGRIRAGSRLELAGNALVIVAPAGAPFSFALGDSGGLPAAFEGMLAVGDPATSPVGKYAKQALEHAEWWKALEPRLVVAEDARKVVGLVDQVQCAAGIVYASDVTDSPGLVVVERIPDDWHDPIVVQAGLVEGRALPGAERFLETLRSRDVAKILMKHGFRSLTDGP